MSLQVHSLASGSSGNVMLVCGKHGDLLLDCGMPRAFLEEAIRSAGSSPDRIRAIVVTHEHSDHTRGLVSFARRNRVPIAASAGTLDRALAGVPLPRHVMAPFETLAVGEFEVTGYPVSHDAREPFALSVAAGGARICYAVDLGMPDERLLQACREASLVVLESNHDVERLRNGPYSPDLKRRILGDSGHLSNDDAARVITRISEGSRPIQFWLAHLSAVNNTPRAALRTATSALKHARRSHCPVDVALRDRPSLHWSSDSHWWQPSLGL